MVCLLPTFIKKCPRLETDLSTVVCPIFATELQSPPHIAAPELCAEGPPGPAAAACCSEGRTPPGGEAAGRAVCRRAQPGTSAGSQTATWQATGQVAVPPSYSQKIECCEAGWLLLPGSHAQPKWETLEKGQRECPSQDPAGAEADFASLSGTLTNVMADCCPHHTTPK